MGETLLAVGGLTFRALAEGPEGARPVLLLHGFPQSKGEWRAQLQALSAAGYRAVAPDQRGYSPGARPAGVDDYCIDHLVDDALAICDALGAPRVDVVGHDWGAIVAWVVAARHPGRVRTLTAVSVPHPEAFADAYSSPASSQHEMSSYIDVFRAPGDAGERMLAGDGHDALRRMFEGQGLTPVAAAEHAAVQAEPGALTGGLNWYRATHPTVMRGIPKVTVPTLLVWGSHDPAISREAVDGCAGYVEAPFRFEAFEGAGHWIPETEAARFTQLLLEHLAAN
ncbi:MAG TPA: alpha/beta hydrolase [Acidimicrobiales bacterium]|nr:alpha/beta hydrolase [Acidimicrobiales bacterium]